MGCVYWRRPETGLCFFSRNGAGTQRERRAGRRARCGCVGVGGGGGGCGWPLPLHQHHGGCGAGHCHQHQHAGGAGWGQERWGGWGCRQGPQQPRSPHGAPLSPGRSPMAALESRRCQQGPQQPRETQRGAPSLLGGAPWLCWRASAALHRKQPQQGTTRWGETQAADCCSANCRNKQALMLHRSVGEQKPTAP